jgi:hypothetical protein
MTWSPNQTKLIQQLIAKDRARDLDSIAQERENTLIALVALR